MPPVQRTRTAGRPGEYHRLAERFRAALERQQASTARIVTSRYLQTLAALRDDAERVAARLDAARASGLPFSPSLVYQDARYRQLESRIARELQSWAVAAASELSQHQRDAIRSAVDHAERMAALQVEAPISWTGPNIRAVEQQVGAVTSGPLARLLGQVAPLTQQAFGQALVDAVALGVNPRQVSRMVTSRLGTPRARTLTIVRTESLRAYREAQRATFQANRSVVAEWRWQAALDGRTCPTCWAMHGERFSVDTIMGTHPNCRCTMVPVTRGYAAQLDDAGIDSRGITESPSQAAVRSGSDLFAELPAETQRLILGPARHRLYRAGTPLGRFVGFRQHPTWGPTRYTRSALSMAGR